MVTPGRTFSAGNQYRYGFNGKENDKDMDGNNYDYGFRIYNPQIGKFLSIDPLQKKYPWYTPYQFAGNSPIIFTDLDGLERNYYIYQWDESKGIPVLQNVVTQTHEVGIVNDLVNAFKYAAIPYSSIPYSRKTEYNGDLITDCSDIYTLQTGLAYLEFSSFKEMKGTTSDAMGKASAEASENAIAFLYYSEGAAHMLSAPSPFAESMQREDADYQDYNLNNDIPGYVPPSVVPRLNAKVSIEASPESTINGKEELIGAGNLVDGVLILAVYLKDETTGNYLLKPKTQTGSSVFENIFSAIKKDNGIINTIQGNWTKGDNLDEFNKEISNGISPESAAKETFTGKQASQRGYTNVSIDYTQSKLNKDGTFQKAVVNFTQNQ